MATDLAAALHCRHCEAALLHPFVDLGFAPPSNAYLTHDDLSKPELTFPLKVFVCHQCWLVQTQDYADASALFNNDYAYFSSTSQSWLAHAVTYSDQIALKLNLSHTSLVVEVASNDGYLLKNFITKNIPCLGIEPTASTASTARSIGVETIEAFFGATLAQTLQEGGKSADLIIGNNVFAHVPNINDFALGLRLLLKPEGVITLEFPHLLQLIKYCQFDTIYHEHYSYLSLGVTKRILKSTSLRVWRVEKLSTHGGSLRIFACHLDATHAEEPSVQALLDEELQFGLQSLSTYLAFQASAERVKNETLAFVLNAHESGKTIACYGAAAKGNTLLNFSGIKSDLVPFVCDAATAKQNKYLPGSHIPIHAPEILQTVSLDYLWILPWNISDEVIGQVRRSRARVKQFLTTIPTIQLR